MESEFEQRRVEKRRERNVEGENDSEAEVVKGGDDRISSKEGNDRGFGSQMDRSEAVAVDNPSRGANSDKMLNQRCVVHAGRQMERCVSRRGFD